jgi:CheY-like chemotaxis protein
LEPGDIKPLAGLKVLLVDDEDDVREVLAILLRMAGAQVEDVATIDQALEAHSRGRPDCVVSDLNLDRDGCVLLEKIRAREHGTGRPLPAVALTGHILAEDREKAFAAGFHAYLTKPVDPQQLVRAILDAVGRARPS